MLDRGQIRLTTSFDSARRDSWQLGSEEVEGPAREASSILWANNLRVGIGNSFEAEIALPVAWMDARDPSGRVKRSAIGDVPTKLTWSHSEGSWSFGVTGGAYWPVGELGAEGLPATATFSTGTIDPTIGAHLLGPSILGVGWQLSTNSRLVVADQENGSRLGSSFTTSVGIDRIFSRRLAGQLQVAHFHRQSDDGNLMEDSGGDWIYLQPQLSVSILTMTKQSFQVMIGARIPTYQNVRGMQLVDSPSLSFGLAYTRKL